VPNTDGEKDGKATEKEDGTNREEEEEEADEEIISPGAAKAEDTSVKARRKADIDRIRTKALLRRGKARMEIGSWSSLQGAEEGILLLMLFDTAFLNNWCFSFKSLYGSDK
jgi:hypothetical protein